MACFVRFTVTIQCDRRPGNVPCTNQLTYVEKTDIGPSRLRRQAFAYFDRCGWKIDNGKAICPDCQKPRPPKPQIVPEGCDPAEYDFRFKRFMSIDTTPAELARRLNRMQTSANWTHATKKSMAKAYASRDCFGRPERLGPVITEEIVETLINEYGTK